MVKAQECHLLYTEGLEIKGIKLKIRAACLNLYARENFIYGHSLKNTNASVCFAWCLSVT